MKKPLTVERLEFKRDLIELVNHAELPAFVKAEVVWRVLDELRGLADAELKRDLAAWHEAQTTDNPEKE